MRKAATTWRQGGDAVDALLAQLDGSVGQDLHFGAGGNWNDEPAHHFQSYWGEVRAGLREQATHCHDVADTLQHAASEMDNCGC